MGRKEEYNHSESEQHVHMTVPYPDSSELRRIIESRVNNPTFSELTFYPRHGDFYRMDEQDLRNLQDQPEAIEPLVEKLEDTTHVLIYNMESLEK